MPGSRISRRGRAEHGQVVVMFALLIPVFFALAAVVLDVGNWYVHKRHLQTQVDAAALASGPQFVGCFHDPVAANNAIASRALAYAGDTLRPGKIGPNAPDSTTNLQVQTPGDVRVVLNSAQYWHQSNGNVPGTNGYGLDHTINGAAAGDPCSTTFLDVKGTDDEAPLLWGLVPLTPSPKARARVQAFDLESARGMLPFAVPEIDPAAVVALFIDETTPTGSPTVFDSQLLELADDASLPAWSVWSTPDDPANLPNQQVVLDANHDRTGVMILVSKDDPDPNRTGLLSDVCDQDPILVACYGADATQTSGLSYIHGYNGGGSGTPASPIIRQVELTGGGGCSPADLSTPHFTLDGGATCSAQVNAVADFGNFSGDPRDHPTDGGGCVRIPGFDWNAGGVGGALGTWTRFVDLDTDSGRNGVSMSWTSGPRNATQCGNPSQQPNSGSFGLVAAPYVADQDSGPIQYLELTATYANGNPVPDANSVEKNDPANGYYNYNVTVGLPKPHQVENYTDPPLLLRSASGSGSQNQTFDCDRGINLFEEVRDGCRTRYIENYRDLDDDGDKEWNNIECTGWGTTNLPPNSFEPDPVPDCVITQTGDAVAVRTGLQARFGDPCSPNHWPDDATEAATFFGSDGGGYGNDPRYVLLLITDDTAFTGSGNEALPVKYYAGFYITGWDYHAQQSPGCPDPDGPGPLKGNDPHPLYGAAGTYNHDLDNGDVWGYFVDIVVFSGAGDASDDECEFGGEPAACIINLVE